MSNEAGASFACLYAGALADLHVPDLTRIKLLRDLARENVDKAPHIVGAVHQHLFRCAPSMRLAALYLVDCLLKNVPQPYAPLFEQDLTTMFKFVWDGADAGLRAKLVRLVGTWEAQHTVSPPVLSSIQDIISPPATPLVFPASMPASSPSPMPAWPPPLPTTSSLPQPILLPPPLPPLQQQPPQQQPPPAPFPPDFHAFMASQGWGNLPMPPPPQLFSQGLPPMLLPGSQVVQAPPPPPFSAPLQAPTHQPAAQQPQQAPPTPLPDLASTLASLSQQLGVNFGAAGVPPQASQQQQPPHLGQGSTHLPPPPPAPSGTQGPPQRLHITQQNIKEYCQPAVDQLLASSDATRSKFLDLQFLRNRRVKSSAHRSRPWYTTVEQWLQGTRAEQADPGLSFFEEDAPGADHAGAEPSPQLVEEDPSQPTCAISGEVFERMYDPDTDKWYYEDAVVLAGEQAAQAGVMDGSIVKVHCLAGAPAPSAATFGIGLTQQPKDAKDDVTPALMDAAANAGTKAAPPHSAEAAQQSQHPATTEKGATQEEGASGEAGGTPLPEVQEQQPASGELPIPGTGKRGHESEEAPAQQAHPAGEAIVTGGNEKAGEGEEAGREGPAAKKAKVAEQP